MLVFRPRPAPGPKTRNRVGIRSIVWAAVPKGEKVTLEQAIAILKAGW